MLHPRTFEVIVVGGGHAGTEAALAASRMGRSTLLLTQNIDTLGQMSCNPAIGGIGKGHLVREIDALGGLMGRAADAAGIQFRVLNASKGPAVRATRAQVDRALYRAFVRRTLERQDNLVVFQQSVEDLLIRNARVRGVMTQMGLAFHARCVVLTVGTFLGGRLHIGEANFQGGRAADAPSNPLSARLRELAFDVGRLKTGTPPRLDGRSIDFDALTCQPGDEPAPVFSYMGAPRDHPAQVVCHITHTNETTHEIIRGALDRSPMYGGAIDGTGPRYCPSVEDKIVRFADKASHQIFVEPEGLDTPEVYPNGISTSMPFDVQYRMVRSIRGFENAHITRPGYAIEYDYLDPRGLHPTLQTRAIGGLFFAGQINGTTGYEEAAAQGLAAGVNAALEARGKPGWWLRRDEAYLGVLIDDLITRGTTEPYRMFTSRAEYRLALREDNADLRLTEQGRMLGLVGEARWCTFVEKREAVAREQQRLGETWVQPAQVDAAAWRRVLGGSPSREYSLLELLRRPHVRYRELMTLDGAGPGVSDSRVSDQVEIQAKYHGYIERQAAEIARRLEHEETPLPQRLDYALVRGLSAEVREKLSAARPATLGQAARISGITPVAISLLLVHLKKIGSQGAKRRAAGA